MQVLLVAKDWGGGLARYLYAALGDREGTRARWLATYPRSPGAKLAYRVNRHHWRAGVTGAINRARRDVALFVNLPPRPGELDYHPGNVLWLTDAPDYTIEQYAAFARIYVSDPGYADDLAAVAGARKFAGTLPFACLPAMHFPYPARPRTDVCFVGNRDPGRDAYLGYLLASGCSTHVYGNYFLHHRLFWRHPMAIRPGIANRSLARIYARHRLSVNIHAQVVRAGTNIRSFECAACEIAQLVQYRPGIESLFVPGEEILVFNDQDELQAGLERLLGDADLRRRLRTRARQRVLDEHTYGHRLESVLGAF